MWRIWGQLCSRTLFDPTAPQKTGCLRLWEQIAETEPKQKIKVNYTTFLSLNKEKKSKRWCFGWKKDNSAFLTEGQTFSKSISGLEMQKTYFILSKEECKERRFDCISCNRAFACLLHKTLLSSSTTDRADLNKHAQMESWSVSISIFMQQFVRLLRFPLLRLPHTDSSVLKTTIPTSFGSLVCLSSCNWPVTPHYVYPKHWEGAICHNQNTRLDLQDYFIWI